MSEYSEAAPRTASLDDLFARSLAEAEVEIKRGDRVFTIVVRALTRAEFFKHKGKNLSTEVFERKFVANAMIEPKMTEADVQRWQESSPAQELEAVTGLILKLSGFDKQDQEAAQREAYKSLRGEPGSGD